jgi:hypothetical protein
MKPVMYAGTDECIYPLIKQVQRRLVELIYVSMRWEI